MSDPNTYEEPMESPKENTMKRAAKAFFAKARAAVKAVANKVAGFLNGHETTPAETENVSVARKVARVVSSVFHAVATAVVLVVSFVVAVVTAVVVFVALVVLAALLLVTIVVMALYKAVQGLALALSSPYHLAQSTEAFKTNWELYLKSWTPAFFNCYRLQSVAYREYLKRKEAEQLVEAVEANIEAGLIVDDRVDEVMPPLMFDNTIYEAPEAEQIVAEHNERLATVHSYQEHKDRKAAAAESDGPDGSDNHPAGKGHATPRQRKSRVSRPKKPVNS